MMSASMIYGFMDKSRVMEIRGYNAVGPRTLQKVNMQMKEYQLQWKLHSFNSDE